MLNESKEIAPPVSTGNAANWRESRDADTITLTTPPSLTPPLIVMINRDTFSVISKSNFMQIFSIERFAPNMVVLSNGGSRDLNGGKITIKSGGDELEVSGSENALVIKYSVWKTAAAPINIRQMQNELSRGR